MTAAAVSGHPARGTPHGRLTAEMVRAATLIGGGMSLTATAKTIGKARCTVQRWSKRADFGGLVEDVRNEAPPPNPDDESDHALAVRTLRTMLTNPASPPTAKVRAAAELARLYVPPVEDLTQIDPVAEIGDALLSTCRAARRGHLSRADHIRLCETIDAARVELAREIEISHAESLEISHEPETEQAK